MKTRRITLLCAAVLCVIVALVLLKRWKTPAENAKAYSISTASSAVASGNISHAPANPVSPPLVSNDDGRISEQARKQIASLEAEKSRRTPAQLKLDSHLIYADRMRQGLPVADGVAGQRVDLDYDAEGRVIVDLKASVSPELLGAIEAAGGKVENSFPQYRAIRAGLPLAEIEPLAARPEIVSISPAVRMMVNRVDSQGDYAEVAYETRTAFGVTGAKVKVGVLSDSVDNLSSTQINGLVTVLPGQSGSPATGEGTPILEIVNDLAPGAQLYFATGKGSTAAMANNIEQLFAAGCNIILDDQLYANESPFQDGIVAQAVNQVTSAGALYFSSAGNYGSKDHGSSSTWEGDFADGGLALGFGEAGRLHSFATQTNYDVVSAGTSALRLDFFWSDPLGASTNDYDVFVLNSTGTTVVASSTNPQTGTQDPYESLGTLTAGELVVILKKTGVGRFLHLAVGGGRLSFSTSGSTRGHNCATNAFGIAAVYCGDAGSGTNAFAGGSQDPVEQFSSDGLRRVFYQADGTPITPGNFSSTGGVVRQKPDLAAADGVTTDLGSFLFNPFYGTSAATPHAAAIAALLLSYNPTLTPAQVRSLLTTNALDIDAAGVDRNTGYGIAMALPVLQAAPKPPLIMSTVAASNKLFVSFNAILGKSYTVQYTTLLTVNPWMTLTNFTAASANAGFVDSLANSQRYYRIQTTTN